MTIKHLHEKGAPPSKRVGLVLGWRPRVRAVALKRASACVNIIEPGCWHSLTQRCARLTAAADPSPLVHLCACLGVGTTKNVRVQGLGGRARAGIRGVRVDVRYPSANAPIADCGTHQARHLNPYRSASLCHARYTPDHQGGHAWRGQAWGLSTIDWANTGMRIQGASAHPRAATPHSGGKQSPSQKRRRAVLPSPRPPKCQRRAVHRLLGRPLRSEPKAQTSTPDFACSSTCKRGCIKRVCRRRAVHCRMQL